MPPTASSRTFKQPGLHWKTDLLRPTPQWTEEPSLDIIQQISRKHLPITDEQVITVTFLAEGDYNKLYTISCTEDPKCYVFRISLPVEPFYKTESEVATLRFVRYTTTIPVPRIIAFNSSTDNELGFEWILLDKVPGCTLKEVWSDWSDDAKSGVVREVAGYVAQMREKLRFAAVGNLYYLPTLDKAVLEDPTVVFEGVGDYAHIAIGPIVSPFFFTGRRAMMQRDRGPFHSDYEYMKAQVQVQIDDMELLLKNQQSGGSCGDSAVELNEALVEDAPDIILACSSLYSLLPSVFPPEPRTTGKPDQGHPHGDSNLKFILHHAELSLSNILVDPQSCRVTGVLDWECVNIHPRWEERTYPQFLTGPVVEKRPPPLSVEDKGNTLLVERMENWEKTLLRRVFDEELGWIYKRKRFQDTSHDEDTAKKKREFQKNLELVESSPTMVNRWIKGMEIGLAQE